MNETLTIALAAAREKNAEAPIALDLRTLASFTDSFLICHGRNARHVQAIAAHIEECLRKHKIRPRHVEGFRNAEWILLDYFELVVHVFDRDRRRFLQLERLWGDAPRFEDEEATAKREGAARN